MQSKMTIEYLPVKQLHEYSRNAKKHPTDQVEHIANSIREFGFRQPLVIDKENVLVIGHGRLLAAKKLGLDTVPCVRADDLTDEQIKAFRLADNKVAESDWDMDLLGDELDEILDIDMSDFGFLDMDEDINLDEDVKDFIETYQVIVEVKDEMEQEDLYNKLTDEGYKCRTSTL